MKQILLRFFINPLLWLEQGATDIIIGIGQYIGLADMRNAYRYRLSVSADKKSYIGSLTDIL